MKNSKKIKLAAITGLSILTLTGCGQQMVCLYGPAPAPTSEPTSQITEPTTEPTTESTSETEMSEEASECVPSQEFEICLYGPAPTR